MWLGVVLVVVAAEAGPGWPTVGIPLLISLGGVIVALYGAYVTARATVRGSQEQALHTERMKLRFGMSEARARKFHLTAEKLSALASRVAFDAEAGRSFWDDFPGMQISVVHGAELVMSREQWKRVGRVVDLVNSSSMEIFDTLSVVHRDGSTLSKGDRDQLAENSVTLVEALQALMRCVDLSSRARLAAETLSRGSVLEGLQQIAAELAKRTSAPVDAGRIPLTYLPTEPDEPPGSWARRIRNTISRWTGILKNGLLRLIRNR
jgi:hypothetical protein